MNIEKQGIQKPPKTSGITRFLKVCGLLLPFRVKKFPGRFSCYVRSYFLVPVSSFLSSIFNSLSNVPCLYVPCFYSTSQLLNFSTSYVRRVLAALLFLAACMPGSHKGFAAEIVGFGNTQHHNTRKVVYHAPTKYYWTFYGNGSSFVYKSYSDANEFSE